ncbi:MAG TPA: hypothetical protein VFJ17_09415 [Mycobacteriales bacterium]|jgi:hypothetical protein|nr:hypothetical protein [Mycobacteriales bacterium]
MGSARRGRLVPFPLLVAGVAMVVAGLRGGSPGPVEPVASPLAYQPPAAAAPAPQRAVRVAPAVTPRAHTARHRAVAAPKPKPKPMSATHRTPARTPAPARPRPTVSAPKPASHASTVSVTGPTHWSALDAAIARIPTYRTGASRWVVSTKYDFWGTADWYHDVLYVDPDVPVDKLYDVAVHEWSHELSVLDYGGDVAAATHAMNATFGGSGLTGAERAADCMAILQGAGWTHYTTCTSSTWRAAAGRLVAGKRLL